MALTPEQFAAELEGIGQDLPRSINDALLQVFPIVVSEILNSGSFPRDTGALARSLALRFVDNSYVGISMLDYGWYQNYGVKGTSNLENYKSTSSVMSVPMELTAFGLPAPSRGSTYAFDPSKEMIGGDLPFGVRKAIHSRGIRSKEFINIEELVERVAELLNQTLEL